MSGQLMAVSNTAEVFTSLFNTFLTLAIIVGGVVLGITIFFIIKYRERGVPSREPEGPLTLRWTASSTRRLSLLISLSLSSLIVGFLIFGTLGAIETIETTPERVDMMVDIIGFQWAWRFVYPNGYEEVGELRVPAGEVVVLKITSTDVFHSFGIPEFKIKKDAIPGKVNKIWFIANEPGEYDILCFEFCGIGHTLMTAKLKVMEPEEFQNWYSSLKVGA